MEWQPIEKAPKDGTKVDLWVKTYLTSQKEWIYQRATSCRWLPTFKKEGDRWSNLDSWWIPTHWMPIPEPPKE